MDTYQRKRLIIIFVFAGVILFIATVVFLWTKPQPTCFDKKQNQSEEGVDCGDGCLKKCEITLKEALNTLNVGFVDSGSANKYDLFAEISNPNNTYGSREFQYELKIKDSAGQVVASRKGASFILPGEKKYLIENNVESGTRPAGVTLELNGFQWIEFNDYYERPNLKVVNKTYSEIVSGIGFIEAAGLLKNESRYDFNEIKLEVILRDASGGIVALNSTKMNTVKSGENREFRVSWPNRFSGNVSSMEVQTEANIFGSDSLMKEYFRPQSAR